MKSTSDLEISIKKFDELTNIEVYNILKLREEVFIVEQNCPYMDCDNKDFISYHLQLISDDKLIGYLRILPNNVSYEEASIGRVIIKKGYRKHNYGEVIVKNAIKYMEIELDELDIRISAQYHLVNFYSKSGFKPIGDIYLEDSIEHIQMYYSKNNKTPVYKQKK